MMLWKKSNLFFKISKWHVVICVLAVLIILYLLVLAPIVTHILNSEKYVFKGIDYYKSGAYLDFENGKDFSEVIKQFDLASDEKNIIDFYYVNNCLEDNPFYGKMCDVYALDVAVPLEKYHEHLKEIKARAQTYKTRGDFVSYALPNTMEHNKIVVVSFCNQDSVVRYIMITEVDTTDGFDQIFGMHTNLDWKAKTSE